MTALSALIEQKLQYLGTILCQSFPELSPEKTLDAIQQNSNHPELPVYQLGYAMTMSDFVEKVLQKYPHLVKQWWEKSPCFADCSAYIERLNRELANVHDETALYQTLRQFRNIEMAKLSFCQSLNLATVEEIFVQLSQLAESLIIAARDWLYHQACAEMGTPMDEQGNPQQLCFL